MLRLVISTRARNEARKAYAYYRDEVGDLGLAERFQDEFLTACRFVAALPDAGSLRFAHLIRGVEIRVWSLKRYPFRIFYAHDGETLRVLDVGHERRNVTRVSLSRIRPKRTH